MFNFLFVVIILLVDAVFLYQLVQLFNFLSPFTAIFAVIGLIVINVLLFLNKKSPMRKIFKSFVIFSLAMLTLASCSNTKPNFANVLQKNYGRNGKSDYSIVNGRIWTAAPGTELFMVPLYEQRADFGNHVLHLKASDNTEFTSKPVYSFDVIKEQAIDVVFDNKHLGESDPDEFMKSVEDNILEPRIYDLMKEASRKFNTDSLMTTGGSLKFEKYVEELVKKEFKDRGFNLLTLSCQLEFTSKVKDKIDQRNEVNTEISVIDQEILKQRKLNELEELKTQQAIIRSRGLTPQILQDKALDKWTGIYYGTNTVYPIVK